jgi:hypothetical protein
MERDYVAVVSHCDRFFKFDRKLFNSEGDICKVKYVGLAVDDSEEKAVFLCKVVKNERDRKPKLVAYLTNLQKTLAKCFQGGGNPKFQEELIYTSALNVNELKPTFLIRKAFFHKDFGLIVQAGDKRDKENTSSKGSHLLYLPRTSLFTGKETNQVCGKFSELHIMQNAWLQRNLTFLACH